MGVIAGIGEGVAALGELVFIASEAGIRYDLAKGNKTIYEEFGEGISALVNALETEEGRTAVIEGFKTAVNDYIKDAIPLIREENISL